jgi:4-amino-4-deoxy-L-arabinose transferase-like glycosyltransferase
LASGVGTSKTRVPYLLFLLFFVYIQIFYGLGDLGLVGPDEPRYAEVAKEMLQSGDFVTPRLSGQAWLEKPVLYYWLTAVSFRLFGVNEWAARLASALAALLATTAVVLVGWDWIGWRGGLQAGVILLSCNIFFSLARAASTDMLLTGALAATWAGWYFLLFKDGAPGQGQGSHLALSATGQRSPKREAWLITLSYFWLALTVLAKGPVGLVLWGSILATFLLLTQRLELIKLMRLGYGVGILALVAGPWYWLCFRANGPLFIQEFLLRQNFERFTTERYQHVQPLGFYFAVIFVGFFPWVFQLFAPAARFCSRFASFNFRQEATRELYLWLWVIIPLLFFSLSKTKLPGYILPTAPSIALLVAREFEMASNETPNCSFKKWFRRTAFLQALAVCMLGATLQLTHHYLNIKIATLVSVLQVILLAVGALGMILTCLNRNRLLLASYLTTIALVVVVIINALIPSLDSLESTRQLALRVRQAGFGGQPVFLLGLSRKVEYGLNFYLGATTRVVYSEEDLKTVEPQAFLLTPIDVELKSALTRFRLVSAEVFNSQKIMKLDSRQE